MRTLTHNLASFAAAGLKLVASIVMLVVLSVFSLRAQDSSVSVKVLFPFDNASVVENYLSNAAALAEIANLLGGDVNGEVSITTFSSPEGNWYYNKDLSIRRANSIKSFLETNYPAISGKIVLNTGVEAWEDLAEKVKADSRLSDATRNSVLDIISSNDDPDVKERNLQALPQYKSLYANYFKSLRFANISLRIENSAKSDVEHTNSEISENAKNTTVVRKTAAENGLPVVFYAVSEDFIRPSYMGNDAAMKEIIRLLKSGKVRSMVLEGTASPEGNAKVNARLAKDRAENLKNYIVGMFPEMESRITVVSKALTEGNEEDYPQLRCARIVEMDVEEETEAETAEVAENTDNTENTENTQNTENADNADNTEAAAETAETSAEEDNFAEQAVAEQTVVEETATTDKKSLPLNTVVALKTNLLFDAVTALNFEVEVPIGKRFSVMVEDVFPWWETGNKYCFQLWEMGVEGRFWFKPWEAKGTEKLRGFFVGPYVMSGKYDFQFDKSINYQGEFWSAGLTAGYSTPIGKKKWANLEFSLSLGYLQSPYRHYLPTDDYAKLIHDPVNDGTFYDIFLYPTKAKVSLVVPLNFHYNKKEVSHD
jgi:outer membrane protein OmpA-like peptidoglycan-associated protein